MGKIKEALRLVLSTSTDQELQEMLTRSDVSEAVKMCIREELEDRKGAAHE